MSSEWRISEKEPKYIIEAEVCDKSEESCERMVRRHSSFLPRAEVSDSPSTCLPCEHRTHTICIMFHPAGFRSVLLRFTLGCSYGKNKRVRFLRWIKIIHIFLQILPKKIFRSLSRPALFLRMSKAVYCLVLWKVSDSGWDLEEFQTCKTSIHFFIMYRLLPGFVRNWNYVYFRKACLANFMNSFVYILIYCRHMLLRIK
jgi:hypothetical protein